MNKEEVINKINEMTVETFFSKTLFVQQKKVIELIEQLDEPQKVKIPQFVADWIEKRKRELSIREAMSQAHVSAEVDDWLMELDEDGAFLNQDLFARAWLDGYEVEREKRYLVKVKGVCGNHETLNREKHSNEWLFSSSEENRTYKTKFTRKELEEAGFGWVFDCPGIEIEEV
jgi:hypothetical protein